MNKNYQRDDLLVLKIPTELKGYRVQDVDSILDNILEDYDQYSQEISQLRQEIKELKETNFRLQTELNTLSKARQEKINRSMDEIKDNLASPDIIKRISNIEQALIEINDKLNLSKK
jgi:cell division septum initiation protein DivIVA